MPITEMSLQCVPRSSIHDHDTRSASSIDTIYTRTHMVSKFIRYQLPNITIYDSVPRKGLICMKQLIGTTFLIYHQYYTTS